MLNYLIIALLNKFFSRGEELVLIPQEEWEL